MSEFSCDLVRGTINEVNDMMKILIESALEESEKNPDDEEMIQVKQLFYENG